MVARGISGKWIEVTAYTVMALSLGGPASRAAEQPAAHDARDGQEQPQSPDPEQESSQSQRPGVVITAPREADRRTLEYVIRKRRAMLGGSFGRKPSKSFDHPIQAWYVTATRSYVAPTTPLNGTTYDHGITPPANGDAPLFVQSFTQSPLPPKNGRQNDTPQGQDLLRGQAGSLLGAGLTSEFVNVMIIVDSKQVSKYSLTAISDYIGMLALTRASVDACNELPSVIDLLAKDCQQGRATPASLTSADTAYLRALYSANLGFNLNIELGEVRQRMADQIEAQ